MLRRPNGAGAVCTITTKGPGTPGGPAYLPGRTIPGTTMFTCRICRNQDTNAAFTIPDMLYGTSEQFRYVQCGSCKCLQIETIPADLGQYYRGNYYSRAVSPERKYRNPVIAALRKVQDRATVLGGGPAAALVRKFSPNRKLLSLSSLGLDRDSRIMDVGCGTGWLLYALREIGFRNLLGIDPFLEQDIRYGNGLNVRRASLSDIHDTWDLIMYHHAFEHVPDPLAELVRAGRLLNVKGLCLIRIPTVSSYAWEHYREHWVGLEAPRHLYLHSVESMRLLADQAGFDVGDIVYDSTDYQFRGSELYLRGITQRDGSGSIAEAPADIPRSRPREWKERAKELNREGRGDQAAFFLRKREGKGSGPR